MNPLVCGRWDGVHLWVQWDDVVGVPGYWLEYRIGQTPDEFAPWVRVGGLEPLQRSWLSLPAHREGWFAQARVAVADGEPQWHLASEVTFLRSRCSFEIRSERRPVEYRAGDEFACVIDGAACVYRLDEDIHLEAGGSAQVEMYAVLGSGWSQLDHPDHFRINPSLGLTIRNLSPSADDTEPTGRDYTRLEKLPMSSPLRVVKTGRNYFTGAGITS